MISPWEMLLPLHGVDRGRFDPARPPSFWQQDKRPLP